MYETISYNNILHEHLENIAELDSLFGSHKISIIICSVR